MSEDDPPPLWREVVGDTEPWRRGRVLLICVALVNLVGQAVSFYAGLFGGTIEYALGVGIGAIVWWLLFAFIWAGTNWVRWLAGGFSLVNGLVQLVWAFRDGAGMRFVAALVAFFVGAAFFAPSVHFFAVRQRETIRWPEKLAVATVFLLLLVSFAFAFVGFNLYRLQMQQEAQRYGESALRHLFLENDTAYLLDQASEDFYREYGRLRLSQILVQKALRLGDVHDLHLTNTNLRSVYVFPATFGYLGVVDAGAVGNCGAVHLRVQVVHISTGWRVRGLWWQCAGAPNQQQS